MPKVLLIESDHEQRTLYSSLLDGNGFDVVTAADGESGFQLAQAEQPDALLIDVAVPAASSLTTASLIHNHPLTSRIPILCMGAQEISTGEVLQAGGREFLRKPVTPENLVRSLRRYVGWDVPVELDE